MARPTGLVQMSEVVESVTLSDLCRICGSHADWIIELVQEGIIEPVGGSRGKWRFESTSITVVRKVQRLQRDLDINLPGIALLLTLAEENARLKRRVQALETTWPVTIPMPGT